MMHYFKVCVFEMFVYYFTMSIAIYIFHTLANNMHNVWKRLSI